MTDFVTIPSNFLRSILIEQDVRGAVLGSFDAVVAADVLEHFKELDAPIDALKAATTSGGVLVTSLPTENFVYRALRWVFRIEKPDDHYHTAYEVEARLAEAGYRKLRTTAIPNRLAPIFLVTSWKL